MSVYITKYEENGVPFVALLIGEKLFRQKREEGEADSEVLSSALRFVGQKIREDASLQYDGHSNSSERRKEMSVMQDITEKYTDDVFNAWRELQAIWGRTVNIMNFNPVAERLRLRACGVDDGYRFKAGDLIICKRKKGDDETEEQAEHNIREFSVYARVVSINEDGRYAVLDRYLACGRVPCGTAVAPVVTMELSCFYRPMTEDELLSFKGGIEEFISGNGIRKRHDFSVIQKTYKSVLSQIERNNRKDGTATQENDEKRTMFFNGKEFVVENAEKSFFGKDIDEKKFVVINPVFIVGEEACFADGHCSDTVRNVSMNFYMAALKYIDMTHKMWERSNGVFWKDRVNAPYFDVVPLDSDEEPRRIFGPSK